MLSLFPTLIFSAAQVRNVSVTIPCYTPGQYITVSFEAKVETQWNWFSAGIIFSSDITCTASDDAVYTAQGIYDTSMSDPQSNGHYGKWVEQVSNTNWNTYSGVVKIPPGYSNDRYIFVSVKEGSQYQFFPAPWNLDDRDDTAYIMMTECVEPTPTPTFTITTTPTHTPTSTPTFPSTQDIIDKYEW